MRKVVKNRWTANDYAANMKTVAKSPRQVVRKEEGNNAGTFKAEKGSVHFRDGSYAGGLRESK